MNAKTQADDLIVTANALLAAGDLESAIPLYVRAAELFAPYASFEIVAADKLHELGRSEEAVASYQRVVAAVPEHAQAWASLATVLYELGRVDEAHLAMTRSDELDAELVPDEAFEIVRQYFAVDDFDECARLAEQMLHSLGEGPSGALHDFLVRSRHRVDEDHAALQASILVRFKMADFVYWYSDGPAPDREAIANDVDAYLRSHRRPPPLDQQQAIRTSPPPR